MMPLLDAILIFIVCFVVSVSFARWQIPKGYSQGDKQTSVEWEERFYDEVFLFLWYNVKYVYQWFKH